MYRGLEQQALETVISLHRGPVENHRGVCSPGTLIVEGELRKRSISLYGRSVRGTRKGGSFTGDPEGYVEKALETGISFHRGSAGKPGRALIYQGH